MKTTRKIKPIDPTVGRNIRALRQARGISISTLASDIASDVGNLSRLERAAQGYSDEMIRKIAEYFGIPVSDLFTPDIALSTDAVKVSASNWGEGKGSEELVALPLIDIELAEADNPGNLVELARQGVQLSHDYLKSNEISIDSAKCIRVVGNSMEPRLFDGDIVGINTDDRRIRDGKAYGVRHGDLLRVKYLIEQPDGGVIVRSMNRDEFQDELLTKQQKTEELTVLGRVFCSFSTW